CPGHALVLILEYLQHCRAVYGGIFSESTSNGGNRRLHSLTQKPGSPNEKQMNICLPTRPGRKLPPLDQHARQTQIGFPKLLAAPKNNDMAVRRNPLVNIV